MESEDRRNFKRYKKETEFILNLDSGTYNCKIIDYSADGISLYILDSNLSLQTGSLIELNIEDPEMKFIGEVVRTKQTEDGYIVGFKRTNNICGSCSDFRISDILIGLQRSTKTGILEIIHGIRLTKIYIKNGDLIFASSNLEDDRLGEVLIKEGKITLEQFFEVSDRLKATGKRLGTLLVELGYLKLDELSNVIRHQVEEIIVNTLNAECGKFEFKEGPLPTKEAITLNLSAANLIYQGIKRVYNFQYILQDFPQLDAVISLSQNPLDLFQDLTLDEIGKEILSLISGNSTVKEILSLSPVNDFESIKTIFALLSAKIIVIKSNKTPSDFSPEDFISEPHPEIDPEFLNNVEKMYNSYKTLGYYEILGVDKKATDKDIKKSYFSMAKEFHPDRHFALHSEDLKIKLNAIFSNITIAYSTLSNPQKRREYDSSLYKHPAKSASNEDIAKKRFNEGRSRMAVKSLREAEKLFSEAIYFDDSKPVYHYYYGMVLNKLRIFKDAAKVLNKAIQLEPQNAEYFAELGHAFLGLGFNKRAGNTFKKALSISPSNEKALEGKKILENS